MTNREAAKQFIETVQANMKGSTDEARSMFALTAGGAYPHIWFGYGYFQPSGCLLWRSEADPVEVTNEEALDALFT